MKTSFFIRKKTDLESYVGIIINHNYKAHRFSTPFTIQTKDWEKGYPKRTNVTKNLRENMEVIRQKLDEFIEEKTVSGGAPTHSELSVKIKRILGREETSDFKVYLSDYLKWKKGDVEASTFDGIEWAFKMLLEFNDRVEFGDINLRFGEGFKSFLYGKGYRSSTVNLYTVNVKAFFSWLNENEILEKTMGKYFKSENAPKKTIIALSRQELRILEEAKLSVKHSEIRDLFLFSCYTGLRWSDVNRFDSSKIVDGFIVSTQKKTLKAGTPVTIPIGLKVSSLLAKYNNELPKHNKQTVYSALKIIFKKLNLNRPILDIHSGEMIPLFDVISFHVARKTFATLALSDGANASVVKMVGGWKNDSSFNRYVNFSTETLKAEMAKTQN